MFIVGLLKPRSKRLQATRTDKTGRTGRLPFTYTYDNEGNRTSQTEIAGKVTEYEWDHRNRLVWVTEKDEYGNSTKVVEQTYDANNRWIGKRVDDDADGTFDRSEAFVYDNGQIVLRFNGDGSLANRYLWGPIVDQLMADEQLLNGVLDQVLWPFSDNLGTVRDLATYDEQTDTTSVVNHKQYDAFGTVVSATSAIDTFFGFTGRALDQDTGLQNNWHRWLKDGRWLSEDWIYDDVANTYRYVHNSPTVFIDPDGQQNLAPAPSPVMLDNLPDPSDARHHLGVLIVHLRSRSILVPYGANHCHRWVEVARDKIVERGKEWYDNEHYKIEYIEWRFPPIGGWVEHAALRITFANGQVAYMDNGEAGEWLLCGTSYGGIFYPSDVPPGWREIGIQSLDKPKGKPYYATFGDFTSLPGALWDLLFGG